MNYTVLVPGNIVATANNWGCEILAMTKGTIVYSKRYTGTNAAP